MAVVNFVELPNKISVDEVTILITKKENGHSKEITAWEEGCEVSLELFGIALNGFTGTAPLQGLFTSTNALNNTIKTFVDNYNKKFSQSSYYALLTRMRLMLNNTAEEFVYLCNKVDIKTESDYVRFIMCLSRTANEKSRNIGDKLLTLEKFYRQQKDMMGDYLWIECGMPTKIKKRKMLN